MFNSLWLEAPLSMGFSRQEFWSGLPCLPPGDLPNPGIEPQTRVSYDSHTGRWILPHQCYLGSPTWHIVGAQSISDGPLNSGWVTYGGVIPTVNQHPRKHKGCGLYTSPILAQRHLGRGLLGLWGRYISSRGQRSGAKGSNISCAPAVYQMLYTLYCISSSQESAKHWPLPHFRGDEIGMQGGDETHPRSCRKEGAQRD